MKKCISAILCILLTLGLCACSKHATPVADSIKSYMDSVGFNKETYVKIADFTSFEWERVLIFNHPTTNEQINKLLGVEFTGSTDLMNGMIFIKDDEIVHYEYFDYSYADEVTSDQFMIMARKAKMAGQTNNDPPYRVFSLDDAVFRATLTDNGSRCYYKLYQYPY